MHNLKRVDARIPHGRLVVVTVVSGSGKSSLAREVLRENLTRLVGQRKSNKTVDLRGCEGLELASAQELHHTDLAATNTVDAMDEVAPVDHADCAFDGKLSATLKPLSWNVFVLKPAA